MALRRDMAFGLPGEYVLISDGDMTPSDYAVVSKLMGRLNDSVAAGGPVTQLLRYIAADGTLYTAQVGPGIKKALIKRPPVPLGTPPAGLSTLWIPHGFVFVPGDADAPQGWGLPVLQQGGDTSWPFGAANIDPGVDVTRWTVGGPAAQILLTSDVTTNYPDTSQKMLSIGYDVSEVTAPNTSPSDAVAWHVVRPTFNGFAWTSDQTAARQSLWRSVAQQLNKSIMALPFAGYYDDAQAYADFSAKYGADSTKWPVDYKTPTARDYKDGVRGAYTEMRQSGATASSIATALAGAQSNILLDIGINGSLTTATAREIKNWIDCGNIFWHPDDASLPTLTWDGYPAQNLPFWLVEGGWVGDVGSDIFPLESWQYQWRGQTRYVYSKNLYAMGRCIGVLPDTVIAAAIRKETVAVDGQPDTTKQVNRVVVITWRASDQFGNASGIAYLWQFRVWCADFDVTPDVPLHVADAPIGAYDATANPTGWQACGAFNIAAHDGSLGGVPAGLPDHTIWQAWRFNGDGTRAVAAYGIPPYASDIQGPTSVVEVVLTEVSPGTLAFNTVTAVESLPSGYLLAADYDTDGGIAYVWDDHASYDATAPSGVTDAVSRTLRWSHGGDGEIAEWAGIGVAFVPDKWVLDAREGAMALTDYWLTCTGSGAVAQGTYRVRLSTRGARVATDTYDDFVHVAEQAWTSDSFLDRLNASYARDRDGHTVMGYDLGTTQSSTPVYVSAPICGQPNPATTGAPVSSYFGSRWLFDDQTMGFAGLPAAPMRAFPVGVC